jgi:conserved oligomeric Golgi complex subunit 4
MSLETEQGDQGAGNGKYEDVMRCKTLSEFQVLLKATEDEDAKAEEAIMKFLYPKSSPLDDDEAQDFFELTILPQLEEYRRIASVETEKSQHWLSKVGDKLELANKTASSISKKVHALEDKKIAIAAKIALTKATIQVKESISCIKSALRERDYSSAAKHVQLCKTAMQTRGIDVSSEHSRIIADAETRLEQVTVDKFDAALAAGDENAIVQYYRVFAALGKSDDGLKRYVGFLKTLLKSHHDDEMLTVDDRPNAMPHVQIMSRLLNRSSELMQTGKATAENCMKGGGNVTVEPTKLSHQFAVVISAVNKECDFIASKLIKRFIDDKRLINLTEKLRNGETEGLDANGMEIPLSAEADYVLNQCAMLTQHCENYFRWLIEQGKQISRGDFDKQEPAPSAVSSDEDDHVDGGDFLDEDSDEDTPAPSPTLTPQTKALDVGQFGLTREKLGRSALGIALQELSAHYIQLEAESMQQNSTSAFERDEISIPPGYHRDLNGAFQVDGAMPESCASSAIEETFFLLQNSAMRALATGVVDNYCAVINFAGNVVSSSLVEGYGRRTDHVEDNGKLLLGDDYSASALNKIGLQMLEDSESSAVTLNNLHAAFQYTGRLVERLREEGRAVFFEDGDQDKIAGCLEMLSSCGSHCKKILDAGLGKLCATHRLRVRGVMDAMNGAGSVVRYDLDENEYDEMEALDPFRSEIVERLKVIIDPYRIAFVKRNFEYILHHVIETVSRRVEGALRRKVFSHFGGLKFDQDLRALLVLFTERSSRNVRKRFARLSEMALVLSVEVLEDISEFMEDKTIRKLNQEDLVKTLNLRSDFSAENIQNAIRKF